MKSYAVSVYGRVQGVGFRLMSRHVARRLGVVGWVQNNDDGSVAMIVQGEDEKVRSLLDWIEQSPGLSVVDSVFIDECAFVPHEDFSIVRSGGIINDQKQSFKNLGRR